MIPLFPGYIFLEFDGGPKHVRSINSTRGVQYILTNDSGRPSRLPHEFVDEIRANTDAGGVFSFQSGLSEGQCVRMRSGPFTDLLGQIEALDDRGRACVLIELMARAVRVDLPLSTLQSVL